MNRPRLPRLLLRLYSSRFQRSFGGSALSVLEKDLDDTRTPGGGGAPRRAALLAEFAWDGLLDRWTASTRALRPGEGFWNGWGHDIRVAVRSSIRRAGFSAVAVASLAIGLGANA